MSEVESYIAAAPDDRRPMLEALRAACLEELAGFEESMEYGMASYSRGGEVEVALASQKQYVSLYVLRTDVVKAHRDRLAGLNVGKSCIRYRREEQIDIDVVRSMLRQTVGTTDPVC